jgi:sigma-E factor negative regulatory protein RseA
MKYVDDDSLSRQELLSALHDGQLNASDAAALVRASLSDESLVQQWRSMSAISDVMRGQQSAVGLLRAAPKPGQQAAAAQHEGQPAANDGVFRWKMVAGVAALAAVGSLVWGLLGAVGDQTGLPQGGVLAQNQSAPQATQPSSATIAVNVGQIAGQDATMIRNPRLDELLAAHKQFGGVSALHQSTGALRSVSLATQHP